MFFLQLRLQGNGRPRATLCMLRIVMFFFTEVSQMKERNLVNSVHDDMLMMFPLDFSEFFFNFAHQEIEDYGPHYAGCDFWLFSLIEV